MKLIAKGLELLRSPLGVILMIPASHDNELSSIKSDKEYEIEIKEKRKRRSLNANNYMWSICQKIAEELSKNGYTSKYDVYRQAIKSCGHFTYVPVRIDAINRYIEIWQGGGDGWIAEDAGECNDLKGFHNIKCYHGSSTYNTKEMARLIDCLVDECNQLGIQLEPSEYIRSLIEGWGNEQAKA